MFLILLVDEKNEEVKNDRRESRALKAVKIVKAPRSCPSGFLYTFESSGWKREKKRPS